MRGDLDAIACFDTPELKVSCGDRLSEKDNNNQRETFAPL